MHRKIAAGQVDKGTHLLLTPVLSPCRLDPLHHDCQLVHCQFEPVSYAQPCGLLPGNQWMIPGALAALPAYVLAKSVKPCFAPSAHHWVLHHTPTCKKQKSCLCKALLQTYAPAATALSWAALFLCASTTCWLCVAHAHD